MGMIKEIIFPHLSNKPTNKIMINLKIDTHIRLSKVENLSRHCRATGVVEISKTALQVAINTLLFFELANAKTKPFTISLSKAICSFNSSEYRDKAPTISALRDAIAALLQYILKELAAIQNGFVLLNRIEECIEGIITWK